MDVNLDGNTITNGYFSGIGEELLELNADNITSGTLDDARLSALVALLNVANTFTAPQSIAALANLTTNGFVKTTGSDGTLAVDTSSYISGSIALTGDAIGSGTNSIPVTVEKINGTALSGLASGLLHNTTSTGVPSIATPNQVASALTGICAA
jgi:hypothetical protein